MISVAEFAVGRRKNSHDDWPNAYEFPSVLADRVATSGEVSVVTLKPSAVSETIFVCEANRSVDVFVLLGEC